MRESVITAILLLSAIPAAPANAQSWTAQPWSVASDMPVATRVITFEHRGAMLCGTLFSPADRRAHATLIATHRAAANAAPDAATYFALLGAWLQENAKTRTAP